MLWLVRKLLYHFIFVQHSPDYLTIVLAVYIDDIVVIGNDQSII